MSCINLGYYQSQADSIPKLEVYLTTFLPRNKSWTVEEFLESRKWVLTLSKMIHSGITSLEEHCYQLAGKNDSFLAYQECQRLQDLMRLYQFVDELMGEDITDGAVISTTTTATSII